MPNSYVLSYINELLSELAMKYDSAGRKKIAYIDAEKSEWYDLPKDCLAVKRCINDENNYVCDYFIIENGQIQFTISGSYKIEHIAAQNCVINITDIPGINLAYHEALAYGVAFKETNRIFMHEDMIQGNNKYLLMQEYLLKSKEANDKLSTMKRSRRRINYSPFY